MEDEPASGRGVLLEVAYRGTAFAGFAPQPGQRTVHGELERALREVDAGVGAPRGTSRTDAGVHARAQMVAFDASLPLPPRGWVLALNRRLPDDLAVRAARTVPVGFSPRFASAGKRYEYTLRIDPVRDPFAAATSWRLAPGLDVPRMRREAARALGRHDFGAFRAARDPRTDTVRTLRVVDVGAPSDGALVIAVEGDAFLYNMVRILVGTLVDVGRGRLDEGAVTRGLATGDRAVLGTTAPPEGLCLARTDLVLPEGTGPAWPS